MDNLPPDKIVMIAKADHALLAQHQKHSYLFVDIGKMDQMPDPYRWHDATSYDERYALRKHGLPPGQRVLIAHPRTAQFPFFYIIEHRPCSTASYNAFSNIVKSNVYELNDKQMQSIAEILQEKANKKTVFAQADVTELGGRKGVNIFWDRLSKNKKNRHISRAFFFVSAPQKRIIEEFGYEGAQAPGKLREEAENMFRRVQFVKP